MTEHYQQAKHAVTARFLECLKVKGKSQGVRLYELVSEKGDEPPDWPEHKDLFDRALNLHAGRKWDQAIAAFEAILQRWPDDGPSRVFLQRCRTYKIQPPPEDWDGSFQLSHK